jgi:plastocyanin
MRVTSVLSIVGVVVALAACGDSSGPSGGHSTTIHVQDNFFTPSPDTVSAGTVTFSWDGSSSHSLVWDTGPTNPGGAGPMSSGTFPATVQLGTYTYHCGVHGPSMHGTIVVQ